MSVCGWVVGVACVRLGRVHRQRSVGGVVLPFVLAFVLFAQLSPPDRFAAPAATGVIFAFHVTLSILAYAAFGLSCVLSLIYLGEQRLLHEHRVGDVVWRLPSLDLLDRMSQSSVLFGLISITIVTALVFVLVDRLTGNVWRYDATYVLTLLVLAAYVFYLRLCRN